MPISLSCPACQRLLTLPDGLAGQRVACPYCGAALTVPQAGSISPSGLPSPGPAAATGYVNPFEAPTTIEPRTEGRIGSRGPIRPSPLDLGAALAIAWEAYQNRFGLTVGAFVITLIVTTGPTFVMQFGRAFLGPALLAMDPDGIASLLINGMLLLVELLIGFLLQSWIGVGWWRFLLGIVRGDAVTIEDLFVSTDLFVRSLLANLLYGAMMLGAGLVCFLPATVYLMLAGPGDDAGFGFIVSGVLVFLVSIALGLIFGFYMAAIADGVPGVIEAFRVSARITQGNRLTLFALLVVAGIIGMLGVCACYIGMIFTVPMTWLALAAAYLLMSGQIERAR